MSNDAATTKSIETFTLKKWNSDEEREAGEPPYEITQTTVTTTIDKATGQVISREQRESVL
jgi:hypothetical protein